MIVTDIQNIYKTCFGGKYVVPKASNTAVNDIAPYKLPQGYEKNVSEASRSNLFETYNGIDVFIPVTLATTTDDIYIPCVTINATRKNTIIRTAVAEREGTIKEQFCTGDWVFNLKGVLIGKNSFPQQYVEKLIELSNNRQAIELKCGYTDLFFPGESKVVIESIEFPETQGKSTRHRPFTMTLESDFVDTLIYEIGA